MTALRLIDISEVPQVIMPPTTITRAYCPHCRDFTVVPETNACAECLMPLDRRYEFVELDTDED